jgi:aryl-alcohol dehydrogenase-like predicted oxidoreductase
MESTRLPGTDLEVSRIALGTWAIGGFMWGGTDEAESIATILAALERGVTLIDTAPVYGFGVAERTVGAALREHSDRAHVRIATKFGLEWTDGGSIVRNGSRERLLRELDDSLERLGTDYLDIYFVHWPDCVRRIEETAAAVREIYEQGVIKAVGVSNFTPDQMERFRRECPLHVVQPPYNIFERSIESGVKPWCEHRNVALMTYGALCRGLLSGKMGRERTFNGDDLRRLDPKFQEPRFSEYLAAAEALGALARERFGRELLVFAVRWILEMGVPVTIWGGRRPAQMAPVADVFGWSLDAATLAAVDSILAEHISRPAGPEFMAPPTGLV